ncbi:MAG: PAS domain S-box protein [Desulfuromonadaceae bacterium]
MTSPAPAIPTKKRILAATIAAFIITALLGTGVVVIVEKNRSQKQQKVVADITYRISDNIQNHLSRSLSATYALAAIIRHNNGRIDNFETLATEMLKLYGGISSLALAPQGVVSSIVPLAGNEKAIGHNLLEDVKRNKEAILAKNTRKLTLAGPFELVQGGRAVAGRLPVFITAADGTDRFWGFVAVLVGIPQLMNSANLQHIVDSGYHYELSRIHPDSGKRDVFERSAVTALSSPFSYTIEVPNGTWTLFVERTEGWFSPFIIPCELTLVLLVSTLISFMFHTLYKLPLTLQQSEERFRALATIAPVGIFYTDSNGNCLYVNPTGCKMTGLSLEESFGLGWLKGLHPDDRDMVHASWSKMAESQGQWGLEYRFMTSEGKISWVYGLAATQLDASGKIIKYVAIMQDITERKQAEQKLLESEERFKKMFSHHSAVMLLIEPESGKIIDANLAAEKFYGYSHEELLSTNIDHINTLTPELIALERQAVINEKRNHFIFQHRLSDGEIRTVEVYSTPITVNNSNLLFSIIQDITSRMRAEEEKQALEQQFQQTQKLESLGVLSGGIAHDFNNILAIIIGYCGLTKMNYETAQKNIPEIEKAAERAAGLCRQMLAYAGKASLTQSQVNTWMLVDEMVTMLKTTTQQNVVIKPELGTDIPTITGDASQIRQIVMNLIINAAEAIGDAEGEIAVKLAKAEIKAGQTEKDHLGVIIPAGRYICFEVTDNGCGMDDDTRRKIFEPFYTTKFTGRGLGMSAVLGIIKAHNGALQFESQPGQGTTFKVYLPAQLSKSEAEESRQNAVSASWHGSGTILLAEDEVQVKSIAIALLQKLGFNVIDAANGKEALELYQQNAADITMVVTDMGMPVMNGYELFYKLKKLNPKLPIIISSGFGEGDIASKIPREEIAGLINKPYNFDHLRDVLKGVVERVQ